jgi:hypothetical protein
LYLIHCLNALITLKQWSQGTHQNNENAPMDAKEKNLYLPSKQP